MTRLLLIINPKSGKGTIRSRLLDVTDIFIKEGYDVTIYISQQRGDARHKVEKTARYYDLVVCSGGDGTLDEVISGMMESERKCPIGYIPSGSTNDFANSLKIPKNIVTAAKRITEFNEFLCDIGCFNNDYFVYVAAFGLFTDVSYETNQDMKNLLGHMAYLLEGAKKLTNIKSYHLTAKIDDETEISGEFIYGMITNSTSVGGFKNITGKNVRLDDGLFEVTLVRMPKNIVELQAIMSALVTQTPDDKYFFQTRARKIELVSEEPFPWALDGEYGGEHTEVSIRNAEKALTLLI